MSSKAMADWRVGVTSSPRSKVLNLLIIVLLGCLEQLVAGQAVEELGENDFDTAVEGTSHALVAFTASWCPHSRRLERELKGVWSQLMGAISAGDLLVAQVDTDQAPGVADSYGIRRVPEMLLFSGSAAMPERYAGPHDAESIAEWASKRVDGAVVLAATSEHLPAMPPRRPFAVGNFPEGFEWEQLCFHKAAMNVDGVDWIEIGDGGYHMLERVGLVGYKDSNAVIAVVHPDAEASEGWGVAVKTDALNDAESVANFVRGSTESAVADFESEEGFDALFAGGERRQLILFSSLDLDEASERNFARACRSLKGRFSCAKADLETKGGGSTEAARSFGLSPDEAEGRIGALEEDDEGDPEAGLLVRKYLMASGTVDERAIVNFADAIEAGVRRPATVSESEPESPRFEGSVRRIVANEFDALAGRPDTDLLLVVDNPHGCQASQALAPALERIARLPSSGRGEFHSLLVARMDGTANEHPLAYARHFPSIFFFPAGTSPEATGVRFRGSDRSVQALVSFAKSHCGACGREDPINDGLTAEGLSARDGFTDEL